MISDTHDHDLRDLDIPDGDVLIHSGDATGRGTVQSIAAFNHQLGCLPHKHKLFVPGNHDWLFEKNPNLAKQMLTNATLLIDEAIEIDNIKFYGSPQQPAFCNWAFNVPRGKALKEKWDLIPEDTNVLITHSPPKNILDLCPDGFNAGCEDLLNRIKELNHLKLHVFGHIHFDYGTLIKDNVQFVNASICTEEYHPLNTPIVVNYENK